MNRWEPRSHSALPGMEEELSQERRLEVSHRLDAVLLIINVVINGACFYRVSVDIGTTLTPSSRR